MSRTSQSAAPSIDIPGVHDHLTQQTKFTAPLRQFREVLAASRDEYERSHGYAVSCYENVGRGERIVSAAAGSVLALLGVGRRDLTGAVIAAVGGALVYRGATGYCPVYERTGVNTATDDAFPAVSNLVHRQPADQGVHITEVFLINKSPEELYAFWRNFENFPRFMSHLKVVQQCDDRRSHWVAKAPAIMGGEVEWDAEITVDEPNNRIAWRTIEGSDVAHSGSVRFVRALGDRGTAVRVELDYQPPAGKFGRWIAKLFGEEPEQQIREDLRNFKRMLEIGEIISIEGQPRGVCTEAKS